tara:strand:+ start:2030 stop:2272 length:243 start_codon:yes stop_codon:yes gene_type:complete
MRLEVWSIAFGRARELFNEQNDILIRRERLQEQMKDVERVDRKARAAVTLGAIRNSGAEGMLQQLLTTANTPMLPGPSDS